MQVYDEELGLLTSGDEESDEDTEAIADPEAFPIHSRSPVSGLYARPNVKAKAAPAFPLRPAPPGIRPIRKEEIRLDVDGRYPQMMVSGTISGFLVARIHWIARLTRDRGEPVVRCDLVQGRRGGVVPLHRGRGHGDSGARSRITAP